MERRKAGQDGSPYNPVVHIDWPASLVLLFFFTLTIAVAWGWWLAVFIENDAEPMRIRQVSAGGAIIALLVAAAGAALYQAWRITYYREERRGTFRTTRPFDAAARPAGTRVQVPRTAKPTLASVQPAFAELEDGEAKEFLRYVLARAGLDADRYQSRPLQRRLPACLRALRVQTIAQARALLDDRPDLLAPAVNSLLIGVTAFFRDAAVFEALRTQVLPDLLSRTPGPLRAWCAGCSSGQELYSLAILLVEAGRLDGAVLLGTDCRPTALETAREGRYAAKDLESVPSELRDRYFQSENGVWRVVPRLRAAVEWKTADVLAGPEPGPWDLILWRNAAIYLTPAGAGAAWRHLAGVLRPGGFLVTGPAERPTADVPLTFVRRCLYRRKEA